MEKNLAGGLEDYKTVLECEEEVEIRKVGESRERKWCGKELILSAVSKYLLLKRKYIL